MEDDFTLPVLFEGKELALPARLRQYGYKVMIEVEIEGTPVVFERDEEGNWRAVMGYEDLVAGKKVKKELLIKVADVIEEITR